jgi:hypothetical protein
MSVKDEAPVELDFYKKLGSGFYETKLNYKEGKDAWNIDQGRLHELFERDLFAYYGVTNNPKKNQCYQIAWEMGHAHGINEVASHFSDIVELIK